MIDPLSTKNLAAADTASLRSHQEPLTNNFPIGNTAGRLQKLHRATQEFEAMLISNFWKSMTESFSSGDEDSLDPGHSTWQDMGVQSMSEALSKAGGLGLGKMILKHLEPLTEGPTPQNAAPKQ
jgi:Rod binding domain-containing protein